MWPLCQDQVKALSVDLSGLEEELDAMKPPARDVKTARIQIDEVNKLLTKVSNFIREYTKVVGIKGLVVFGTISVNILNGPT